MTYFIHLMRIIIMINKYINLLVNDLFHTPDENYNYDKQIYKLVS